MTSSTLDLTGLRWLSLATAAASAVTGGALFAFSSFVTPALDRLPARQAIAAMQSINVQAPRSLLMLPLLGSAAGSAAIAVWVIARSVGQQRAWLLIGAAAGVLAFVITATYHVPHNDALAKADPHAATASATWASYTVGWARWNHVRAAAALASAAALVVANVRGR
jgi:uncharacterized membrane protein